MQKGSRANLDSPRASRGPPPAGEKPISGCMTVKVEHTRLLVITTSALIHKSALMGTGGGWGGRGEDHWRRSINAEHTRSLFSVFCMQQNDGRERERNLLSVLPDFLSENRPRLLKKKDNPYQQCSAQLNQEVLRLSIWKMAKNS